MYIFDVEGDGLHPSKIYCLSYFDIESKNLEQSSEGQRPVKTLTKYEDISSFLLQADTLVGHNIARWDIPTLERILKIKIKAKIVDTLALSWYLYPKNSKHGLEHWGEILGIKKPEISDWHELELEDYIHRCEEDIKINTLLWQKMWKYLKKIYETEAGIWKLTGYLEHKMNCARLAEESRWLLDIPKVKSLLVDLKAAREDRVTVLTQVMPPKEEFFTRHKPKKMFNKEGELTVLGQKWVDLGTSKNITEVQISKGVVEPNPNSSIQVKEWLYSLGWVPETIKYDRHKKTGRIKEIPQVQRQGGGGICNSVKKLYEKEPNLEHLDGLSILNHRIPILEGFLSHVDDQGYIQAKIAGLTNTLRFKHSVLVNLPKVDKPYGEEIRGCLKAPEGYELCGSDQVSLEDRTKQHFIWPYDPKYVQSMMSDDFDPHLDIAELSGMMSAEQVKDYKEGDHTLKPVRTVAKNTNYAATYGAQAKRISLTGNIPIEDAEKLVETYWKRNWALNEIAKAQKIKDVGGQLWLFNKVSRLWYTLRNKKDIFSTLNQGTGTYCFDVWVYYLVQKRPELTGQFHDEIILTVKKGYHSEVEKLLQWALDKANKKLNLNRELDIDVQFGGNYAEIH